MVESSGDESDEADLFMEEGDTDGSFTVQKEEIVPEEPYELVVSEEEIDLEGPDTVEEVLPFKKSKMETEEDTNLMAFARNNESTPPTEEKDFVDKFSRSTPRPVPRKKKLPSSREKNKIVNPVYEPWFMNPKDLQKRKPTDPNYDPSTLYIPEEVFTSRTLLTPAMKQYWRIKSRNFDTLVGFKVGKFYEFYDLDAEILHNELDMVYMASKHGRYHCGFPEQGWNRISKVLVGMGYKICRVEQLAPASTVKKGPVPRGVIEHLSPGCVSYDSAPDVSLASYLFALCESISGKKIEIGVAFVDTSTGRYFIGQFEDDRNYTTLRTLIVHLAPKEVLYPRRRLSPVLKQLITRDTKNRGALIHSLVDQEQFWSSEKTMDIYWNTDSYFTEKKDHAFFDNFKNKSLALSSFGATIFYLKKSSCDSEILSMNRFEEYSPISFAQNDYVAVDGETLENLDILSTQASGTKDGSLLGYLDKCQTSFGKRLLRHWVQFPLSNVKKINERLDCVEFLKSPENYEFLQEIQSMLKKLSDLERLLSSIHSLSKGRDRDAQMFDPNYDRRKIEKFLQLLQGLRSSYKIQECVKKKFFKENSEGKLCFVGESKENSDEYGRFLSNIIEKFPKKFLELLEKIEKSFDQNEAIQNSRIIPAKGADPEYDEKCVRLEEINDRFDEMLREVKRKYGIEKAKLVDQKNCKKQIEIPSRYEKTIPDSWIRQSAKKGYVRFHTPEHSDLLSEVEEIEIYIENLLRVTMTNLFGTFTMKSNVQIWLQAIDAIGELDCIISLAVTSTYAETPMTRPIFVDSRKPFLELIESYHPCTSAGGITDTNVFNENRSSEGFVPNTIRIGVDKIPSFIMVTGPNMGGKSTLLRQVCVNVIMAQIGCYVPADKFELSVVDRIFTRIGANDRILSGQSTFMVELEETSNILRNATKNSLVILDELGRGTSTFDGTSIAHAVTSYLSRVIGCRTLFSTHYHLLTKLHESNAHVMNYRMTCKFNPDSPDPKKRVVFLYKFEPGVCENSYGMECALVAGVSQHIVDLATKKAERLSSSVLENFNKTLKFQ